MPDLACGVVDHFVLAIGAIAVAVNSWFTFMNTRATKQHTLIAGAAAVQMAEQNETMKEMTGTVAWAGNERRLADRRAP